MNTSEMISHEIIGSDGPWLVFIHGLTCDRTDWRLQVDALKTSYRCLLIDSRGHGASADMPSPYNVQTDAQDLARLLDHHGVRNAILIGHSRGVRVGSATAALLPEAVSGLVFVDGSQQGHGNPETERKRVFDMIESSESLETFCRNMFAAMFPPGTPSVGQQSITQRAVAMPQARFLELMGDMVRWDAGSMEQSFATLKIPVGVVQGTTLNKQRERRALTNGEMTPFMEMVGEIVPHAFFDGVPNVGHFVQLDAPESVVQMIRKIAEKLRH